MTKPTLYVCLAVCCAIFTLALAGCVSPTPLPPTATVQQVADAKTAALQANFTNGCKYANGAWGIIKPLTKNPVLMGKIGADLRLGITSLGTAAEVTCSQPLDLSNADAITQRLYDIAGEVIAGVMAAQR